MGNRLAAVRPHPLPHRVLGLAFNQALRLPVRRPDATVHVLAAAVLTAVGFGKGFGDLSNPALRPLAVTGELYHIWSDHGPGLAAMTNPMSELTTARSSGASANSWFGGFSLQYSLVYVQEHMKTIDLPPWAGGLIPLVEFDWISPSGKPTNVQTAWRAAPGVVFEGQGYELAVEAQVPLDRSAGKNVGVIAQYYFFLDDLYPNSIGSPVLNWFR